MKKIFFRHKGKQFNMGIKECRGLNKIFGLMFKSKNTNAILFEFKKPTSIRIHSFFVFFPFVAVWLDEKNRVIKINKIRPFTLAAYPKKEYDKLIEIPINKRYLKLVKSLDS